MLATSLHESGRSLFPGTGSCDEVGRGDARGTSLNVPLPPATTGEVWLHGFDAVVPQGLDAFNSDVLVTQLACDTHVTDPLTHLALTTDDDVTIAPGLHDLAHRHAAGRRMATGGGGSRCCSRPATRPGCWPTTPAIDRALQREGAARPARRHLAVVGLVVADHGMAGAAVHRGIPTLSIVDVNDPALPLAQVRGRTDGVLSDRRTGAAGLHRPSTVRFDNQPQHNTRRRRETEAPVAAKGLDDRAAT